jgi:hypothetical protein
MVLQNETYRDVDAGRYNEEGKVDLMSIKQQFMKMYGIVAV